VKKLQLLSLSSAVAMAVNAWAADEAITQDKLVVQGDLFSGASQEDVFFHPGGRTLVNEHEFEQKGAANVRDALNGVPGVFTPLLKGTGSAESGLSIGVRGLPARLSPRTYVLLDGVPVSYAPYGQPQLSFAPLSLGYVEQIDVMRNGGAVRYGPNNPGGTINFVSRAIPESFAGNITASSTLWQGGANDGDFGANKINLFAGDTLDNGLGLALFYAGSDGDSHRAHSDYQTDDLLLKYNYALNDDWTLSGRLQHYNADGELPGGLTQAEFDADPFQSTRPFGAANGQRNGSVVTLVWQPDVQQEFEVTAAYNETYREFTMAKTTTATTPLTVQVYPRRYTQYSVEPRYSRAWGDADLSGEWSLGYRYSDEKAHERRFDHKGVNVGDSLSNGALKENAISTVRAHAVYADNRFSFGNWDITPGVRYEYVKETRVDDVKGITDGRTDFREWLPSVNALYSLSETSNLYASYNTTFAPIQFRQLLNTAVLEPETAQNIDLGFRTQQDNLALEAGLFYIDFDNMIEYNSTARNYFNTGRARYQGVELSARYDLPSVAGLSLFATYTYLDAQYKEGANAGNRVAFSSEHAATLGADYASGAHSLRVVAQGMSDQFADDANTEAASADGKKGRIPGSGTLDLNYSYQLAPELTLSAGAHNLFDKLAYSRSKDKNGGIYVSEPRHIYLAVSYDF